MFFDKENKYETLSDEQLIPLIIKKKELFSFIIDRYEKKLSSYLFRSFWITNPDDILQDIFIKIYTNLNSFNPSLKFSSWIYRITHNHAIDTIKKQKLEINFSEISNNIWDSDETDFIDFLSLLDIKDDKIDFWTSFDKKNLFKIINESILSLPENYKDVLILKYFEEKDYDEISDILKVPNGTVASWLNRARNLLKEELIKKNILHFIW